MNAPDPHPLIGASVQRKEDYRFLTGNGQYTDDVVLPQQTYAVFLRSPYAHARIKSVDTAAAKQSPGVVAVFTGADMAADKVVRCRWRCRRRLARCPAMRPCSTCPRSS